LKLWESAQAKAEQIIAEALRGEGVGEEQLCRWRKGYRLKVKVAWQLRKETTVSIEWISRRLKMGTRGHLANLLYQHQRASLQPSVRSQPELNL